MGCVQSAPYKPRKLRKTSPCAPQHEELAAARLLAEQQKHAAEKAAAAAAEEDAARIDAELSRRDTAVLKKAGVFDKLEEDAHKDPSLRVLKVVRGAQSARLLEGFEAKEAESREVPALVGVEEKDIKQSRLYGRLQEFEDKDKKAAAEPKLEKTFVQRERENSIASGGVGDERRNGTVSARVSRSLAGVVAAL